MSEQTNLAEAICQATSELMKHTKAYNDAKQETMAARMRETSLVNIVNEFQRKIDELMEQLRKEPGKDTVWANKANRGKMIDLEGPL